jgi:hypothetical protein
VLALRPTPPEAVFGALGHRFEVEGCLTAGEIADLQAQLGVELPGDYRSFLLEVGAGGAGPAYGVFSLRRAEGGWSWFGDGAELTSLDLLARDFPGPIDPDEAAAFYATQPDEDDFDEEDDYMAALVSWERREEEVMWSPARTVGALCLCHLGCALREWLIVTTESRGTMWRDERADGGNLTPIMIDGEHATFGRWYLEWLVKAEAAASDAR